MKASTIVPLMKWKHSLLIIGIISLMTGFSGNTQTTHDMYCKHQQAFLRNQQQTSHPLYAKYDVGFYGIDIALERNSVNVAGHVEIRGKSLVSNLDTLCLELLPELQIDSVVLNTNQSVYVRDNNLLFILVNPLIQLNDPFVLRIYYHGTPPTGGFFAGISTDVSTQWGNEVTWTLSEPFNARDWFPVKQDLKDKADSAWIFITTDTANKAGSNGILTAITPMGNGKHRFEWKTSYPIDYYLISAAVADYQEYTLYAKPAGFADSIPIVNYIYDAPGCLEFYQTDLDRTRDFLELFSEKYGLYPFAAEKYGHCQVHLGGGMEHQTMSTMGAFNFDLNSHELSHQWFGDHVTCATWSDIWLNEGFATYSQYIAAQQLMNQTAADDFMIGMQNYVMSEDGGSVYIPPAEANDVWRIFNGRLSYNKGAVILHVLRYEINNDELFFEVLRQYQEVFGGETATGDDFFDIAGQVTGLNFQVFANQWYYGEGFPVYDIHWLQSNDSLFILSEQHTSSPVTPFYEMHVPFRVSFNGGDTLLRFEQQNQEELFVIPFVPEIQAIELNPRGKTLLKTRTISQGIARPEPAPLITVFPNPFEEELRVFFKETGKPHHIRLADVTGRIVLEQTTELSSMRINTRTLAGGLYILMYGENESATRLIRK